MNGNISAKKESDLGDARKIATPLLLRKGLQVFLRNGRLMEVAAGEGSLRDRYRAAIAPGS